MYTAQRRDGSGLEIAWRPHGWVAIVIARRLALTSCCHREAGDRGISQGLYVCAPGYSGDDCQRPFCSGEVNLSWVDADIASHGAWSESEVRPRLLVPTLPSDLPAFACHIACYESMFLMSCRGLAGSWPRSRVSSNGRWCAGFLARVPRRATAYPLPVQHYRAHANTSSQYIIPLLPSVALPRPPTPSSSCRSQHFCHIPKLGGLSLGISCR